MSDHPTTASSARGDRATIHRPFDDDGVTYCGWDGIDGCGEVWPCSTVRGEATTLNQMAEMQATEVERIWPTPEGQDPVLRQVAALTEEVGEIARAVLKRSHASRSADGTHKGQTVDEWTQDLSVEIGQALGVLLGLAHQEGMDIDGCMAETLYALRSRPSIIWGRDDA